MSPKNDDRSRDSGESDTVRDVDSLRRSLQGLAQRAQGVDFILGALASLATRYNLRDVTVIVSDETRGKRMFRLGARPFSAELAAPTGMLPGVYSQPKRIPPDARTVVYEACQRAFNGADPVVALPPTNTVSEGPASVAAAASPKSAADATPPVNSPAAASPEVAEQTALEQSPATLGARSSLALSNLAAALTRVSNKMGGDRLRRRARSLTRREGVSVLLAMVDLVALVLTLATIEGPVRFFVGLVLGLLIPGWSVVSFLRLRDPALEFSLSLAVSLAIVMSAAQIMTSIDAWHPMVLEELTSILCLPALLWQTGLFPRPRFRR